MTRQQNKRMKKVVILAVALSLIFATMMILSSPHNSNELSLSGFENLKLEKTITQDKLEYHLFQEGYGVITKSGTPITSFEIENKKELTLTNADVNLSSGKAYAHTNAKSIHSRDLYIPRKPHQDKVHICENATSLDEVYLGCENEKSVNKEYTLHLQSDRVSLTPDGKYFIVHNIAGTGGVGEGDWWNENYIQRQNINITPNGNNLSKDYTLNITFNAANLISQNQLRSDGNDLRIVYWNGTANKEIDRINITRINSATAQIEFKVQKSITNTSYDYYIYYNNPEATTPPQNKSNIYYYFEDFEDQAHSLTNGALSPTINTAYKKNGAYGLGGDGQGLYRRAVKPESLERGMTIEGWVYSGYAGDNADLPGLCFGMQASEKNGYQIVLDWRSASGGSSDMQIREDYGSGTPLDTSTENTVIADKWYYISATWKKTGEISATIYDENMNYYGSVSAVDQTYTTGYYGINAYKDGLWDDVKVTLQIDSPPQISYYPEENLAPVINNPQANPAQIQRGQPIIINASVTTDTQVDKVYTNITLPNNSIIVKQMSNTSSTYNATFTANDIGLHHAIISANNTEGYRTNSETLNFEVYGYAKIKNISITPGTIIQGGLTTITCLVIDENTSQAINNYPVQITTNETGLLGNSITNSSGHAKINYLDTTLGLENIVCTVVDNNTLYYNASTQSTINKTLQTDPPSGISILSQTIDKSIVGYGDTITISSEITSPNEIQTVIANITPPDLSKTEIELVSSGDDTFEGTYSNIWQNGNYTIKIWANDSSEDTDTFPLATTLTSASNITILSTTDKSVYEANEDVNIIFNELNWWNDSYEYRKQITVSNTDSNTLKQKYTIEMNVNTSELIANGKVLGNCDDLRVIFKQGTTYYELDRLVDNCNTESSKILFAAQANISSETNDSNYYLYYGNSQSSNPPSNKNSVYLVWDDFEDYTLNAHPGNDWTDDAEITTNDWQIKNDNGNKVLQDIATDGTYHRIWKGDEDWDDYEFKASVKLDSFLFTGLAWRRQPWSGSYYDHYVTITDDRATSNKLTIRRWSGGGSNYQQLTADNTDFIGTAWNNYTMQLIGTQVNIKRNNVQYISYDLSNSNPTYNTGGYVGLMSHQGQSMFDNVQARLLLTSNPSINLGAEELKSINSTITNNKNYLTKGHLISQVEKNNEGSFEKVSTIINDTTPRTFNANEILDLTQAWNLDGGWNTGISEEGEYRINTILANSQGIPLVNEDNQTIEANTYFNINITPPTITLLSPQANYGLESQTALFNYAVDSSISISNCKLKINGAISQTDTSITKSTPQTFAPLLPAGTYNWQITCTDSNNNEQVTETRVVHIIESNNYQGLTTNLNNQPIENINNLTIEQPQYGLIKFDQTINLSGGADLNNYITIAHNEITINSAHLPQLNKTATLTLYNLDLEKPIIIKDGAPCSDCNILSYTGNLTFTVQHFTTYSASENSELTIGDQTDHSTSYPFDEVDFTANYSNLSSGASINGPGIVCNISFEDTEKITMQYNTLDKLYHYNRSFDSSGNKLFTINCTDTNNNFASLQTNEYASITQRDGPTGISNITVVDSKRGTEDTSQVKITADVGNVSRLNIDLDSITQTWQAFYGTIDASILLADSQNSFYEWNYISISGELYAARVPNINFATINCSTQTEINAEELFVGLNSTDLDSVNNTFNQINHPSFEVGNKTINSNSCRSTNLKVNGQDQTSQYYELLLNDNIGNIIYTALLENSSAGYDNEKYDFQMIVGGENHNPTDYYFYLELD